MTIYTHMPELGRWSRLSEIARQSTDPVRQVGCMLVMPGGRTFEGFNNTSFPVINKQKFWIDNRELARFLVTHAEMDCLQRAVCGGVYDFTDAIMYVTLEPCGRCREVIEAIGIKEVFYKEIYVKTKL